MAALPDENSFQFAALYTLQHGLTRNAQFRCGYDHGHVLRRCLLHDPRPQFIVDANLPGRTWRDLLAGNESICQPTMDATGVHAQDLRRLANRNELSAGRRVWRLEPWDTAIASQAPDLIGGEAFASGRLAALTIQNSGDDFVGIKSSQAAQQ